MRTVAVAVGSILAAVTVTAVAQPYYRDREARPSREGERQDDLDFARCRRV